jgi:hypothetical protein
MPPVKASWKTAFRIPPYFSPGPSPRYRSLMDMLAMAVASFCFVGNTTNTTDFPKSPYPKTTFSEENRILKSFLSQNNRLIFAYFVVYYRRR